MAGSQFPSGAVTFLFTDIEGSTRLIDTLGEASYVEALAEHRRLLRAAFSARGGVEVDTQGDAFLFAFSNPADAIAAAAQGQQALETGPVRVRMGLHTGEPLLTGEGYAGRELHRAARIAAAGHGGQVVLSAATRAFVHGELTELGEHRLKDFTEPVALFQLERERFPPLKTISNTNLPRGASSFVGRVTEREELVDLLSNGTRLVTLNGPGGSGKTRLAVEAASELVPAFAAGVFWIGLAALRDPALVTEMVAQTLGAKDDLAEHIAERDMLLLLDNFEQVVEAAPALGLLLARCPNLKLMVTSRELLRISGEVAYPVPPLAETDAVELFCERSRLGAEEPVAELCRRLDNLPLALELAAARTSVLSPAQILERLSQRLDLLRGGRDADPRQQTLRATIEWSHDLLDEGEQRLFAHLAVFRGGATLEAAEQIVGATVDSLQSLVDKSLVRHSNERFWMLETIREYAGERLASSGAESIVRRRHALYALDVAETAFRDMDAGSGRQADHVARIADDFDNLRAALEWGRDSGEGELLLRLTAALTYFWHLSSDVHEAEKWDAIALERASSPPAARMTVLRDATIRAGAVHDYVRANALVAEWRTIAEQEHDENQLLMAMNSAAVQAAGAGDLDAARAQFMELETKAAELGHRDIVAFATINLGSYVALPSGDFAAAYAQATEAVALFRELHDDGGVAMSLEIRGWSALGLSDPARAEESFNESISIAGGQGARGFVVRNALGLAAALVGEHEEERGAQLLGAAAALSVELEVAYQTHMVVLRDRAVEDAKAALGEDAFAQAWARGEAMTPEDIVAFTMPA